MESKSWIKEANKVTMLNTIPKVYRRRKISFKSRGKKKPINKGVIGSLITEDVMS